MRIGRTVWTAWCVGKQHAFYLCQLFRLHTMEVGESVSHAEWESTSCKPHLRRKVGIMVVKRVNTSSQSNSVSLDQIKRKFISEIRKIIACVPLLISSQECCTCVRMCSLKGVLKNLGRIGKKLIWVPETHPTVREIKSISFSRSSGSEMLLVNCLHLLEHWCPIQEPHDNYQMVKYCTKMQWLEADATQTQMNHILSVRVMIHWNNLEY